MAAKVLQLLEDLVTLWTLGTLPEMDHHVLVEMGTLGEILAAQLALELPHIFVDLHMTGEVSNSGEHFSADSTRELLLHVHVFHVCSERGVRSELHSTVGSFTG